jgi:hypothetical protein
VSARRACRKDANHDELSDAARRLGWYVVDTYQFAQYIPGWPDAVWAREGRTVLVEYKTPSGRLTKDERLFQATWPGEYVVVRSVEDVIAVTKELGG